jgi:hypothetical protein
LIGEEAISMQNQPGPGSRNHEPGAARHDRQAASVNEDVFKGGSTKRLPRALNWLRSPWKPAAGRLWPDEHEQSDKQ